MLTYEDFLDVAKSGVETVFPGVTVSVEEVQKLQGQSYTGLMIRPEGGSMGVSFNPGKGYEEYREDPKRLAGIMSEILSQLEETLGAMPEKGSDIVRKFMEDYDSVKDHLRISLVGTERNADLLETFPHREVADLSVIYKLVFTNPAGETLSVNINKAILEEAGISEEQLHRDAVEASAENCPEEIATMEEKLGIPEMPGMPAIYVLSNSGQVQGAAAVLYPGVEEKLREKLGGDFYILPSSIHEVLAVRKDLNSLEDLRHMVKTINQAEVSKADQLSDNVYELSGGKLRIALTEREKETEKNKGKMDMRAVKRIAGSRRSRGRQDQPRGQNGGKTY